MLENEMFTMIKSTFPHLEINKIQKNNHGWDNDVLIVNNEIVFRFPKSESLLSKLYDEIQLKSLI